MTMLIRRVRLTGVLTLISLFFLGQVCLRAADPITHQVPLPAGMTWCDDASITGLLTQVNAYRSENGLPGLRMDALGMKDAEMRATQFAAYMVSNPPGSPGFNPHQGWDTTAASLGYKVVSENLAFMTSDPRYIVYSVWQDALHRAAMLASDANVAGVSCVYSNGTPYWTYEPGIAQGGTAPVPNPGADEAARFLTLINGYRAQSGLNPVQVSPTLQSAAAWMSNDMATKNYANHTDSLGRSVGTRLAAFGYTYVPYGENIAGGFGDAQSVLDQWKNACDPDASGACTYAHRKAMLNPSFTAIGVGRTYSASSAYGWYWVTDFGGYLDSSPVPPPSPSPVISSFVASPTSITPGQSATLAWSVSGATAISIDNGVGNVSTLTSKVVAPGQTTTYRLTATNGSGTVSAMATVTVSATVPADTQPPTAPTLSSAVAQSGTRIDLAWRASTDNVGVAGYQILRNGSPAGSVAGSVLAFTDSVAASTSYTYTVRAFDIARNYSPASNAVQVTTPAPQSSACPPAAQGAFTGCYYNNIDLSGTPSLVRTDSRIDFDWRYTSPAPAVSGSAFSTRWQGNFGFSAATYDFAIEVSDGIRMYIDGDIVLDRWRDQAVTRYSVRRTLSAGNHIIRVEYYARTGSATARVAWAGTSPVTSAPAISSFTATPSAIAQGQSATLSWAVSGASAVNIDNGIGGVSTLTSKSVSPAQTTTYRLTASNSAGVSTASATVYVNTSTGQDTNPPTAPVLTSASPSSPTRVDIAWTASSDNVGVAGYRVLRNGAPLGSAPASARSYVDSTSAPNTTYKYAVQAFDAAGNYSLASNSVSLTTPAAPVESGCTPGTNVFTGCYYSNADLSGTPALVRSDSQINFDWMFTTPDTSLPRTNYSVRWQGSFTFQEGYHTFYATASDGIRVYIDGTLILDRWRDQPVYSYAVKRLLTAGVHLVTMEYYERTGTAVARLSWQRN